MIVRDLRFEIRDLRYVISSLFIFLLFTFSSFSQGFSVKGIAIDSENKKPLISATVQLIDRDSVTKYHDLTNKLGEFNLTEVKGGAYNLKITYIGHKPYQKQLRVMGKDIDLGKLEIKATDISTDEIEVTADAPIGKQKLDTTEYNAGGFKTAPDATAEDLVNKMPGVQVDKTTGTVTAQGETVKKVLVDGKQFFGDDPTAALRNLPSEVIDKVQVYDKMSEQSEFTGFDDGQTNKTMNIITKKNRRNGQFGKFSGGYGRETENNNMLNANKYIASLNLNLFDDARRISILGISNNVNQQNFSVIDILDMVGASSPQSQMFRNFASRGGLQMMGGPPRGGGGFGGGGRGGPGADFSVGQSDGVNSTNAIGGNYSDYWGESIDVTGSYFYNNTHTVNNQVLNRQYFISNDTTQYYNQNGNTSTWSNNHRFNFRFNYQIDTNNTFLFKPTLNLQATNNDISSLGTTIIDINPPLNQSNNQYTTGYSGYNFSNELLYKHRFGIIGRTFSIDITTGLNDKTGSSNLLTLNSYNRENVLTFDTLNQKSQTPVKGYSLSANVAYTEPIHENGQLMISYNANYNSSNVNKRTDNYDPLTLIYDKMDTLLSNKYDNFYFYQKTGLGYRFKTDAISLTASLDYQKAELNGLQDFPYQQKLNYTFYNFLPGLRLNYKIDQQKSLNLHIRTSTSAPSIQQLQNVVDNSNQLQLSVGNPELKQQMTYSVNSRYNSFSSDFNQVFFSFLALNFRPDYIGNSTFIASKDTLIQSNILLASGAQLTKPVNLDGYWSAVCMANYGFPFELIQSKLNINVGGNYTKTPSLVNGKNNFSNAYNLSAMFMIASNISENLDFTISSRANWNRTVNSINTSTNYNYNNFITSVNLKWVFWEGIFVQGDMRNQFYTGIAPTNGNYTLINFSIGKKLLNNDNGELKLSLFDVLKENKSNQTNVTDYYTENVYNTVLQRYIMLTFTYNLRNFAMGKN